jgi:hypothetical protein
MFIFDKNLKNYIMKKLVITALLSLFAVGAFSQNLDEIVKKHIDAIGGLENWKKLKSLKMECSIKANGADIKVVICQLDKKAMRQDIAVMGMNGYEIVTNTQGWSFMPFQGQTKPEAMTADDVKNAQDDLWIQDEFITYKELGKKLELIGSDDMDGTECFKLKMTDKNNQETTYYIYKTDYNIIKSVSKVKANGKEVEVASMYGNYKKTEEGLVFAMSNSGGYGPMEITKIEVNPKIDEVIFQLPK